MSGVSGWSGLVGAERPRAILERAVARGDVAHAYLFAGPDGVGKREGALLVARALLCERGADGAPCGACAACLDGAALRHEDLLVLHPAANPFWHEPARLASLAGLPPGDAEGLAALLEKFAAWELIGRPVPVAEERRRLWPIALSPDGWFPREGSRPKEDETVAGRIGRLRETAKLGEAHARLARFVGLPPLSVALYRRGARGLGIGAIAPREGGGDRSLKEFLEKKPARGRRKVAIVDEAHWMTEEAQNALLKTLEEPPPGAVLILVTANPGALLPTILSRARRVAWRSLHEPEILAFLERTTDYAPEERALLASLSGGAPGRALRDDPAAILDLRGSALTLFRASVAGDLPGVLAAAARFFGGRGAREEDRERILKALDLLLVYVRDLRARELLGNAAGIADPVLEREIDADIARLPPGAARAAARRLLDARARLLGFCDPRLVVESLAYSMFPRDGAAASAASGR